MTVDPETLRALAIERLTTGSGPDTELALSADERGLPLQWNRTMSRLALSFRRYSWPGNWHWPRRDLVGNGGLLTALSRDGKKIAFVALRAGKLELWEKSLVMARDPSRQ